MKKIIEVANSVKEWDKKKSKQFQEWSKLSDYQMVWANRLKGIVVGVILL